MDARLSRRELVQAGAGLALSASALGPIGAASPSLAAGRAASYSALVEALAERPGLRAVDPARAGEALRVLKRRYAAATEAGRENVDAVLDALDRHGRAGEFAALGSAARQVRLQEALVDDSPAPGGVLPRRLLVEEAVALAAAPFYPPWMPVDFGALAAAR